MREREEGEDKKQAEWLVGGGWPEGERAPSGPSLSSRSIHHPDASWIGHVRPDPRPGSRCRGRFTIDSSAAAAELQATRHDWKTGEPPHLQLQG